MIEYVKRFLNLHLIYLTLVMVASNAADRCRAEFEYTFGFGQSVYAGAAGEVVHVDFFIRERVTNGSTSRFSFGNSNGLFSIGATMTYSADFGNAATVDSLNDVTFTPAFDGFEVVLTPLENRLEITSFLVDASLPYLETDPDVGDPNSYTIKIGTVTFRVGSTPGNNTTISITNREVFGLRLDNNLAFESSPGFFPTINIDDIIQGSSTRIQNVTAVPEPPTIWLSLITAALGGYRLWTKRKARTLLK